MIRWSKKLYMDERVALDPERWKRRAEKEPPLPGPYLICLANHPSELLELFGVGELWFGYERRRGDLYAVGLASGKQEAQFLLEDLLEDIYRETKSLNIREYFTFSE